MRLKTDEYCETLVVDGKEVYAEDGEIFVTFEVTFDQAAISNDGSHALHVHIDVALECGTVSNEDPGGLDIADNPAVALQKFTGQPQANTFCTAGNNNRFHTHVLHTENYSPL